jgi:hypothetical protein
VQVLRKAWAAPIFYCLTVLGSVSVIVLLAPIILTKTIVLARPLAGSPTPLSLMQRREIDAALSLPPSPNRAPPLVPAEIPAVPIPVYVARLDSAEMEANPAVAAFELESAPSSIVTERMKLRVARAEPKSRDVTPKDIFNRSFGVITAVAN